MPSTLQVYDALPSETASATTTLCQPETQLSCENADPSTTAPPKSKLPKPTYISRLWTSWKWEFAACVLVLATPIIIFATLYPHSGQPLPRWPFKISINSLLSVYALVFKAAIGFILTSCIGQLQWMWFSKTRPLTDMLHFDNATRGADGALGLIWRQRFRQPLTALGCIIMVLVATVDPFVQQLVRPVDCSIKVSGGGAAATLPRTNVFEGFRYYDPANKTDTRNLTGTTAVLKATEGALFNGLFSPAQDPPWQCSTGNCTFTQTYGTIGMCHSCQDTSAHVSINTSCWDSNSLVWQHPTSVADCPEDSAEVAVASNFTTGEKINLGTKWTITPTGLPYYPMAADAFSEVEYEEPGLLSRSLLFGFLSGASSRPYDRTFQYSTTSDDPKCDSNKSDVSWSCQGYGAATCSLNPCVQIYNATVSAGIFKEVLVASSSDTPWGGIYDEDGTPFRLALLDTQCSAQNQTSSAQIPTTGSRWLPYNLTLSQDADLYSTGVKTMSPLPDNVTSLLDSGCLYLMFPNDIMASLEGLLKGTVQGDTIFIFGSQQATAGIPNFSGPELIKSIYNWGQTDFERVQRIFSNISYSLTTYIRTHGGRPQLSGKTNFSRDAQGEAYHYATCLKVQWPWITFASSLAVFTAVFFLTVAEATNRLGTPTWKVSPLAWILRADGLGNERHSCPVGLRKGMKNRSKEITVHLLDEDSDGPRICMADIKDPNLL